MSDTATSEFLLEVIACSVEDAREAEAGGAGRLEIVRDLDKGGLTPPLALVREILDAVSIPIRVMIRERSDYLAGTSAEQEKLRALAANMGALPINGLVMGFLKGKEIDLEAFDKIRGGAPHCPVTFHHAFEDLADPPGGIDRLGQIPRVDRVLTAGGSGSWLDRKRRLAMYCERAVPKLTILAGGGMSAQTIRELADQTRVREFHVGTAAREHGRVTRSRVEGLCKLLKICK